MSPCHAVSLCSSIPAHPLLLLRVHVRAKADEDSNEIFAGDLLSVRPMIRDKLGNPTAATDGTLIIKLHNPDGTQSELKPSITIRSGLTNYDVRYEPQLKGTYHMHVSLAGAPIEGSPVVFDCIPNLPDISKCRYELPSDSVLYAGQPCTIYIYTHDRCGNALDHGGASVAGRLQSANLPSQQETALEVEDFDNGVYGLTCTLRAATELKVILSVDRERPGGGGEFTPIPMAFINPNESNVKIRKAVDQVKASTPKAAPAAVPKTAEQVVEMAVEEFQMKGAERASARTANSGAPAPAAL